MTAYRIVLAVSPDSPSQIDDLDLPLLLEHGGHAGCLPQFRLTAHAANGRSVPVQWLASALPSAIAGQQRGTLLIGPGAAGAIDLLVQAGVQPAGQAADEVRIRETPQALEATVGGQPFFNYRFQTRKDPELPRPIFHPLHGPTGKTITQLGEIPGKRVAHFHHTGLWIAHQNWTARGFPNLDNWQMNRNCTRIEHIRFERVESGAMAGRFIELLHWLDPKGDRPLLVETRTVTVLRRPAAARVIDIDIVLRAQDLPVTLNRTPYHLLACRVVDSMLPRNGGAMVNSDGRRNPPDGTTAAWIDVSGSIDNEEQGVALMNHPRNDRHPVPCLQFSGQTIGLSPTHREALTIDANREARFRFRVLVHAGNAKAAKVAAEYEAYGREGQGRIRGVERVANG
jgi:hypothetical protein